MSNDIEEQILIKNLKKKAQALVNKVQRRINIKGAYENAGMKEECEFFDLLSKTNLHYQTKCELRSFIGDKITNLDYSQKPN